MSDRKPILTPAGTAVRTVTDSSDRRRQARKRVSKAAVDLISMIDSGEWDEVSCDSDEISLDGLERSETNGSDKNIK